MQLCVEAGKSIFDPDVRLAICLLHDPELAIPSDHQCLGIRGTLHAHTALKGTV